MGSVIVIKCPVKIVKLSSKDRLPGPFYHLKIKVNVVVTDELTGQVFPHIKQMTDVASRITDTDLALALWIRWKTILQEPGLFNIHGPMGG